MMRKLAAIAAALFASVALAAVAVDNAPLQLAQKDTKKAEAPKADAKDTKKAELMDINSASEKELASLKGIGEVRAKAIVKHRPYKGKDELVQKKIIPEKVYADIKDQIIAKQK